MGIYPCSSYHLNKMDGMRKVTIDKKITLLQRVR
ncbi:hypothetical protein BCE_0361 [Bacillus cereus ATCC 10987]|uniref:Uncharacterized protein n=1 Tax=Bacillus cereus (strain ATCC 10987 / NRS 248) TaxID=222523 RepID=Q73EJ7_BACC1|nr:hypothetical protein BCE_0361 [Bacillus cereus ATCC 10987]